MKLVSYITMLLGLCSGAGSVSSEGWQPPSEAPLPEAFPPPSPPGKVLVKFYPAVRGAFVDAAGTLENGTNRAFWPLFQHISSNKIEMTAPVLANYPHDAARADEGSMGVAFLYQSERDGERGSHGRVTVRDLQPLTVVSVGVMGAYDLDTMRRALVDLECWLANNDTTWQRAGAPRRLMYQNPMFRRGSSLYSEVQIPIEPVRQPE